jgi:hypothetical protein
MPHPLSESHRLKGRRRTEPKTEPGELNAGEDFYKVDLDPR